MLSERYYIVMKESDFVERQISSELIFDGIVLHLYRDIIEQSTGHRAVREIIRHNGAVCVVPINEKGEVVCVKQYRYAHGKTMIEIPAGKLDSKDEDPTSAALRELREETGFTPSKLTFIGDMYGSPAILDEVVHMYLAEGLTNGECDPDEDEIIETVNIPLNDMVNMIMSGEICDAKTQIAALKAYNIINGIGNK